MKISPIGIQTYFNGQNNNISYKKEIEEKSNTTLKLAIGTAIAGAGLWAVYYLSKNKKPPKAENIEKESQQIVKTINNLPANVAETIDKLKINTKLFKDRIISILDNGKTKVEYIGKKNSNILKKQIYIDANGNLQGSITKFQNGNTIVEKFSENELKLKHKKIFFNPKGERYKSQSVITETETAANIPVGFKRTIEISEKNKPSITRITEYNPDMTPKETYSNGSKTTYCYSDNAPNKIIGHAITSNNKVTLKFINNPKFKKEFDNIESLYKWANGNIKRK